MERNHQVAKRIHNKVWNLFTYVSDQKNYQLSEHWTSHAFEVNNGVRFKDDCDGFALTCAELLIEQNVPRSDVYAIFCVTETGEPHLVCGMYDLEADETLILENRFGNVYPKSKRTDYTWKYFMSFDKPHYWFSFDDV